tara:strand:- start:4307 stop:6082 length:1776 start_codon:yes stop_codon:yes gene_type:complete
MSLIKSKELNKNIRILSFLILGFLFFLKPSIANEPVDIWKKSKDQKKEDTEKTLSNPQDKNKIDFSKIQINEKTNTLIEITESQKDEEREIKFVGLFDPQENDFNLEMWSNTDGEAIKNTFKRIEKIKLSKFSEEIFINTIMTYSYAPKNKLSDEQFLKMKLNWLIKNNKNDLIEKFLNNNLEFDGKSKLIKHLVDYYISLADISEGCKKSNFISQEIKDSYLEKFRIYCLILNKKNEEAQLNYDLLREQGKSDKFFDNKFLFLMGINEKPDNKISDKNLLYFYLSSVTIDNFEYEPTQKTDKNIWKYLASSNLIAINQLEDPKVIQKYEIAANEGNFDKKKIFEIYLSIPFNINQLINANTVYQGLTGYEARALIYQKILLSDNLENRINLLFLLKDLFKKDKLTSVYNEYLSETLKEIDPNDIPDDLKKIVERNIIVERSKELGKLKYDDKILHKSRVIKIFTEGETDKDKINKDFMKIYKKISRNKKYFFSIKDVILLEALYSDGVEMPKGLNVKELSKNLTVPLNMDKLAENGEIGMLMLKFVEIIGSDDVENLDPDTLYFIVNILNKAKIKKVRNQILNLTLPLRV